MTHDPCMQCRLIKYERVGSNLGGAPAWFSVVWYTLTLYRCGLITTRVSMHTMLIRILELSIQTHTATYLQLVYVYTCTVVQRAERVQADPHQAT